MQILQIGGVKKLVGSPRAKRAENFSLSRGSEFREVQIDLRPPEGGVCL